MSDARAAARGDRVCVVKVCVGGFAGVLAVLAVVLAAGLAVGLAGCVIRRII